MMPGFLSLMERGGPLMWVIFGTACVAVIMLIERAITLARQTRQAEGDYAALVGGNLEIPSFVGRRSPNPLSRVLADIAWDKIGTRDELIKEVNVQLAGAMARLEGSLPTVAMLGSLLPMLGLLGTVTGMITVFNAVALHGSGEPAAMAAGISQALLTTAGGLAMAIVVIFFHHLLARRLELLLTIVEQSLHLILNRELVELVALPDAADRSGGMGP